MRTIAIIVCVIATLVAQRAAAQQACPILVVSTNDDVVNGNTSSPCALIANPGADGISLREALLAANNATGSGTITVTFAPALAGAKITLTTQLPPITRDQITLAGLTNNGQPDITIDASQLSSSGGGTPLSFIGASYFTMNGLNFPSIPANFNAIQIGGYALGLDNGYRAPAQMCCVAITGNAFSNGTGNNTFAVYISATISNETISDVAIANNSFSQLFEAINLQGGGAPPSFGLTSNSVIQDVAIFGNSFSQITAYAGVELSNTTGTNNRILDTKILQNNFSNSQQGVFLNNNAGAQNSVIADTLIARNVFTAVADPSVGLVAGVYGGAQNNTIANTQIVNNVINQGSNSQQSGGIFINDNQDGQEINNAVSGVSIVNDTFSGQFAYNAVGVVSTGDVSGVAVFNTIFYGIEYSAVGGMTPSQVSYSIINQTGFTGANHNFNADPLFVNGSGGNFELQSGSPALHAGVTAGAPAIDIACQPRGSPPSIGAYEFEGPNICSSTYSAPLTATPTSGTPPLAVTFTASGLALPMTYTVNFGDGTTGALTQSSCIGLSAIVSGQGGIQCSGSASHTYTAAGSYSATLLNALGLTVGSVEIFVTGAAPNAGIAAPHKAATVGSQTILGSQTLGSQTLGLQTLGSQTIPALQDAMQDGPRQTLEAAVAGSNATVPTISSFTASPASIAPFGEGESATLSWSVASATSLSISGLGTVTGNSIQVSPSQTTTYTLTASNAQGAATAQTTVTVAGYRSRRADPLSR